MSQLKEHRQAVLEAIYKLSDGIAGSLIPADSIYPDMRMRQDDLVNAISSLESRGYVELLNDWNQDALLVKMTKQGCIVAEDGEVEHMPMYQNNFNGPTTIQQGNHNVQNIQIGVSEESLSRLIDALRSDELNDLADEVQSEICSSNEPGRLQKLLDKVATAAINAGATTTISQLAQLWIQ